jgi:sugar/nucleoside kinase (ribokinase family)
MDDAIVAGHICLDIIPDLSSINSDQFDLTFQPGRLLQAGPASLSPGGAVSNTGLALHRLGINTKLVAKVGDDELGKTLCQCLANQGSELANGIITSSQSTTSYSIVISPNGVDRRFLHHPGANDDFCALDIQYGEIKDEKLFHFGYPPLMKNMYSNYGSQLMEILKQVKEYGLTTSLDMAFPDPNSPAGKADWQAILCKVLPFVDIFVPSIDEILFMLKKAEASNLSTYLLERVSGELLDMGTKMVLLKLGDQGLYLRTAELEQGINFGRIYLNSNQQWSGFKTWAPCFDVNVVGTTGSGDVTVAGFLAALIHGLPPMDCVTFALGVGACNVETPDALSGVRSWDETWGRINSGWKRKQGPNS